MSVFGKKELEAKQQELNEANSKIQDMSKKVEEMKLEASRRTDEIALEKQRIQHEKERFESHRSEREQALKLQESQMEQEIDARRKMLESQEAGFEAHLKDVTDEYDKKLKILEEQRIELDRTKAEFEPKYQESLNNFAQKLAETERQIQERVSETTEKNLERQKEFNQKLNEAHQKSEKEHEDLLLAQTSERVRKTDEELSERRNLLAQKEQELRARIDEKERLFHNEEIKLQNERDILNQNLRDYEQKIAVQEAKQKFLDNRKAALDKEVQALSDARIKEKDAQLENFKAQYERLSRERAALETQVNALKEIKARLGDEEPEIILLKMQALEKQIASLREKLAKYPDDVEEVLDSKNEEIQTLNDQLSECKEKLRSAQNLAATAEISELNNSYLESQNNVLQQNKELLETLNAEQAQAIRHYRELYDKEATYAEKIKSVMAPHDNFTADKIRKEELVLEPEVSEPTVEAENQEQAEESINPENINPESTIETPEETASTENEESAETEENAETETTSEPEFFNSELKWLETVSKKISDYGLAFSPRILNAFHTALKTAEWSPLAVLAGVSGTGKSELPQLYAKFGGINCVNIPVQPNWDSQESLLGYYNTVSSKFEAQPLLQFLVQTQLEHALNKNGEIDTENDTSLKEQLNIVLLDEMNLAHIEQYFAEFLSKLEERRGKSEDNPQFPKLSVKLGGTDSYPLPLGRNVLWVGTMNQDETTKSLSDKVLDRGIVINFPRPNSFKRRVELNSTVQTEEKYLSAKTWDSWKMVLSKQQVDESEKIIAPYKEFVEEINKEISNIGRAIGHRVWQSIENYIWNYPTVRDFILRNPNVFTDDSLVKDLSEKIDPAFEDQLVQKIMPKLRGIETRSESKTVLGNIRNKIEKFKSEGHALNITKDFENAIKFGDGQFLWVTSEYLSTENDNQ